MTFAQKLVVWQRRHGRHGLPWQGTRDPYRVWLSEVMLQQTQVSAVAPYYRRFLEKYPSVEALAAAQEEEVLRLWSGLGYYARGRNLLLAARQVVAQGGFPKSLGAIRELAGVGRSTAAAIAVFAFGCRAAILDGNVKRVLSRRFGLTNEEDLWHRAQRLLPRENLETYTQALMDLGSLVCTRGKPKCDACPVADQCVARRQERVHELPAPRARKPLPTRRATWFVYLCGNEVLLERRPSRGLWGGLWVFPEKRIFQAAAAKRLPPVEHGFTHFRLVAQPLLFRVSKRADAPGCLWLGLEDAAGAAVPAPVRKLLLDLSA
ncbi:MAG TPA: A/G-specific adenine glycosylase [Burkholderiales bacterium]|nr:A/G-specific adenine glycosylase [Burkholderiales bacterium]